ncbi:MAG: helix-turn-helix transcriptional regulator [Actinomycetota bacterium]
MTARALGEDVAGMLRYQISVLDREDRLESGTGSWKEAFRSDSAGRELAARESILRTFQLASNPECYSILEALHEPEHMTTRQLVEATGLGRLTLQERVGDLVSAGLVSKVPEADQVVATSSGHALAELIDRAARVVAHELSGVE